MSPRTVTEARRQLIAEGKAVPRDHARRHPVPLGDFLSTEASPEAEPEDDRDLTTVIANIEKDLGPALSVEDLMRRLSSIIRVAGTSQLGVSAILALSRIRESLGARDKLGPGPPLTPEERIRRTALILEANTPSDCLVALAIAHPDLEWSNAPLSVTAAE